MRPAKHLTTAPDWRRQWDQVIPFVAFPPEVRRFDAIESLNRKLRTSVRGHFPNDEAAMKRLYLISRGVSRNWNLPQRERTAARTRFAIPFVKRFSSE